VRTAKDDDKGRRLAMDGWSSPDSEQGKRFLGSLFSQEEQKISLIGEDISIVGTLHFAEGVVRLDGQVEGKVIGPGTVIIGKKGLLRGDLKVNRLILSGRLEGTAVTSESTYIAPTGKLLGTVQTPRLVIDEGGIFDGESQFVAREEPAEGSS
jgi:cytoskeletal protein CcmA (bactofilin family)